MVRETRHLWVGNLPDNIREDRIREHFKRYGRVQSVKLLPRGAKEETGENAMACTVAFMDIKSASKAHTAEHKIDDRTLTTEYYEPAAIPSAASPQNTPSSYSTSPGSTRFPNGHGSTEEHGNFNDRFYERPNSRVAEGEFIRRTGYHDNGRGRNRDRGYRNGPYNNVIDRTHRQLNNSWTYDSTSARYNSQTNETGYSSAPSSEGNERRSSDAQSTKKKKSRSGSRSPSPSGSTSSRSPSRSRSRSSSSSSSSTTSRATSSTGSPKSRRLASSINSTHQPVVHSEDRRPLAICVRNLPLRSSDTSLKDGLFHEYKKHGKVTWVKVVGQSSDRQAIVCFKKPEDVEKALEVSYDKLFFGCKIEVAPYQGYDVVEDNDLRPYEAEIDEFHPKATRTLFIGNLEKDVTASDLRKHFDQFGEIIEIDIKKQGAVGSYAFCQFSDIISVVKAIRTMDGEHLGNNRIKLGFGKSMPTNCVWVDGIVESVNEKYLMMQFDPFGSITQVNVDREKGQALIFYEQQVNAQAAVQKMRGATLRGRKIQVDFASRECQEAFYEHLEKQGHVLERPNLEERRDSTTRTFEAATLNNTTNRFSRYDTPTRPRTSSYSSRSSAATSACNTNAVPSPGTPGSVTPRGTSSRSRIARFSEYYDQSGTEYGDRHFRSYDEYSQGSAASHEDTYDHEYGYNHDSPSHIEAIDSRTIQNASTDHPVAPFAQPDNRNLHKERLHILEQLEECPSSGDESISPKKRLKLDHVENTMTSDVIVEANRDHRKVMEVRRLSDASIKHHSRRPSIDSKHSREVVHDRGSYLPHAVCKRRKTAGSDSGSRVHHYDHSGSESVGGSRPGTPLCDERPEHFTPSEPRRIPREREGPLTLPLPRFAAQVMNRGSVSVAGIKGQKETILSSPPPAVTSPRISNPKPPSPAQVPPPASPPPRPPSLSSNSSDSDIAPPSPSLDERIKSLEEKYEKWSGSRALSAAGGDALAKLDATRERFRFRHKLLDLDLKEVQPSEIVKSVMAKRSVFDEDSKRLENVGEKYEPRDFNFFPRSSLSVQTSIPTAPLSAPPLLKTPCTTQLLSPRSAGANMTPAKGLQYPFPSHPPIQPPVPPSTPATTATPLLTTASASTTNRGGHGENRLKPCANVPSDNRTPSKVSVNRNITSSVVVSNLTQIKTSDNKNSVNIPATNPSDCTSAATQANPGATDTNSSKHCKGVRDVKSGDRVCEKITARRDSVSSASPMSETKSRRNSDCAGRKGDESDRQSENSDSSLGDYKKDRARSEERRKEQRLENERLEKERLEKERLEREREEKERIEKERSERERIERERKREREERERKEREERERKEREERERREREEQIERERIEKERKERREREERERREREDKEREKREREEREKREREERERERREREEREKERREKEEKERREREEQEKREREERERREREEEERVEKERLEKERRREKEEERKHKDDNHEKRRDDHSRHRENHSEKHKDNTTETKNDKHNAKEDKIKDNHELSRKDSHESRSSHESKSKHHSERDSEKRKESTKENSLFDKCKNMANEIQENKNRQFVESRHLSIDSEKNRQHDTNSINKMDPTRRKERNNSVSGNIGLKRRMSSHENIDNSEEAKRMRLSQEHRKLSERRDSKDDKAKSKHKNSTSKSHDDKIRTEKNTGEEKRKDRERDKEERHKSKLHKLEKQKLKNKSRDKESPGTPKSPAKELSDKDFLARLDLHATIDVEKQKQQRKEMKEKRKQESAEMMEERKENSGKDERRIDDRKKEKNSTSEKKNREETKSSDERKTQKKERIRKSTHNSSDNTDSDEPKKHSIFDIVDDEPAYISMYDKVKARSCKNMQKQEEEKQKEKIKAKFSQLKQSRAKREEKKRSTSWDEDSDSDRERHEKSEIKRRGNKALLLLPSSDEEDLVNRKPRKKHEIYDSDSDRVRQIKLEQQTETSDDDRVRNKILHRKGSKSRIASDTSDDEFKKLQNKIKSEIFSDNDGYTEEKVYKKVKEEYEEKLIKKERKNSKHIESLEQINAQIFGDSNSPIMDMKAEKYNRHSFGENSSADENTEVKKEKSEMRKKHKKKQKRQKNSVSSEESCKLESVVDLLQSEEKSKHEKKKQHSKKDKKKDKNKDEDKLRDKSKKSRKNKSENKGDSKRDGKMENIFGSLSEDSDALKEPDPVEHVHKQNSFLDCFSDENIQMTSVYASDSDSVSQEKETYKEEVKETYKEEVKEAYKTDENIRNLKEEHRKRKEKRRREKERRIREEMNNENSMDYADMGKQLEANIKDDTVEEASEETKVKVEVGDSVTESTEDSFRFLEENESQDYKKDDRREIREKKKKRKKSKEEKQNRHHHHHHHDKNKLKSPEFKKEVSVEEVKVEVENEEKPNQSLPNILDLPSPPLIKTSPKLDFSVSPVSREPLVSPIPKTPSSSKDKKRDKFIPGFGSEIDEKIHESAIKSISEFDIPKSEPVKPIEEEVLKPEKVIENIEEKPRVVISQEETEDAVAALLGESFGGDHYDDSYNEEVLNQNSEQSSSLPEEAIQQDDEEMRQAVQSLNSGDLEIKPDTPQSEHELQIDTDTDEPDELSSGLKFDRPPRTPDMLDLSQPPKTPDTASYYRSEESLKATPPPATILIKTTPNIGSPPSLTPLKPQNAALLEAKKNLEQALETPKTNSLSVPMLPEQTRTVISQSWSLPEKKEGTVPKLEPSVIKVEDKIITTSIQTSVVAIVSQGHAKITVTSPRTYTTAPIVKINESTFPPLAIIAKQEPTPSSKPSDLSDKLINLQQTTVKASSPSLMHNLPARPPYQVSLQQQKQMTSQESTTSVPSRVSAPNFSLSRLPITPIMVSKPLQPTTVVLPQPKTAHNIEPPKLVPTNDARQDRSRMVCQTATIASYVQTQPRMIVQTNLSLQRGLPPQGLLVPAKQLPPNSYNYVSQPPYNLQSVVKDAPVVTEKPSRSPTPNVVSEPAKVLPTSVPATYSQPVSLPVTTGTHVTLAQAHKIIITTHSNALPPTTSVNTSKPFMPVIQETPKLINLSTSNVELQKCVIFTHTKTSPSPPVTAPQQDQSESEQDNVKVTKDVSTTSTSSPVIVAAHKDTPPPQIKAEVKTEPVKKEEETKPLAIEKVTDELNLTLKKETDEPKVEEAKPKVEIKDPENQPQVEIKIKTDSTKESDIAKQEGENVSVIKETDKFDEEKADTESIVSDISKERSSAEILTKDDALDSKEDSDYWSAKEVNIDSVIKKVDALCSGDELSDRSSEGGKDEWYDNDNNKTETDVKNESKEDLSEKGEDEISPNSSKLDNFEGDLDISEEKEVSPRGRRGGGRTRGRKTRGVDRTAGVQTRRGKATTPAKRGGRGGRPKNERRSTKSESEASADVYEFRDDSDENNANKDRPRLILTIKSPAIASAAGSVAAQTAIVKEIVKETVLPQAPPAKPPAEAKEEFASPVTNTRKSRRLQEKDISRNTVDDTIEDVVRNTAIVTRSSTAAAQNQAGGPRRSTRQTATKVQQDTPRKSPRGGRKKDRRASETTDDSFEEKSVKNEPIAKQEEPVKAVEKPKVEEEKVEPPKEKPHEGLKAAVLRRVKGEMSQEPMTLIDPVTGLLTPMRECEEGRYIPVPGAPNVHNEVRPNMHQQPQIRTQANEPQQQQQQSVITISQQSATPKQQKPQSLKAHVLSSQAAQAVVSQQPPKSIGSCQPTTQQPLYISKPNVPISQSLNVNVSMANYIPTHLSPRTSVPLNIAKPIHNVPVSAVQSKQPPPLSPNQIMALSNHQKQQILQQVKPQQAAMVPKAHMGSSQTQIINTQLAHVNKHQQPQVMKQVVVNKAQIPMKNPLHTQQILTGAVASPPLKQPQPNATRIVQGPPSSKGSMEPPKVESGALSSCVLVPRPNVSPQGQPRHILQAGLPSYEANMGEAMAHFPPGSVPLRPPHDLPPAHYMHHPSQLMYHQYLRQSYHIQPRAITGGLEKTGDGQEGEEAPITSPPLELRRPGSVGLALTGRTGAVPHSLQSPHDRATDSPQVGQMYNVHTARMQHYHPAAGRYYEQTAEPPPAHRQLPSHGSLAALGSDRPLGHMMPLGTPDRPLSSHMTPDRPLSSHSALAGHIGSLGTPDRPISTHLPPDRPLSSHGLALGAGLGAAGNLMGAVARHIGADAPASQRGLQAATPPHASQVPPQAESLLMLLKQYPCMWQGLLALKNDQAAVQMYFVSGNDAVAKCSLPKNTDGSTPPLRIFQRMRLEPPQVEGVARKMQMENEHCMLLALPCGHDHMDVLKQSTNLTNGFITYLQQKQAAGIVNVAAPGTTQPPAYVVHIFPSCDFVNENLRRIAPSLLERVADIAHLLIVITTV